MTTSSNPPTPLLRNLPGDDVRRILWRYDDRPDFQEVVQAARGVARGTAARLVANGARQTQEWTAQKSELLEAFDAAGLTAMPMEPENGGFIAGPKNLLLALTAFELAWVDGGAATSAMATNLALSPIHERGTPEQASSYQRRAVPPKPGENREIWRGSFALTEPLPFVGVNTGVVSGRISVKSWEEGKEPILHVEKKGRFITNMAFSKFITAAVDSEDPRIKGSCMVILQEGDPGIFDRGLPTRKLVHQLSSTRDPVFSLDVPASRIVGGYTVKDGVIIPAHDHKEIIASVFRRTRVTVGLMTSAKLLSAVEPVIRYHRGRFRGGEASTPGTPRFELGLQQKEDVLHRLIDVWATGEASASLGFAAARLFDVLDPLERRKEKTLAARGITGGRALLGAHREMEKSALELLALRDRTTLDDAGRARRKELESDELVKYALLDAEANVMCPACKLWNTGQGVNVMREAVSLMGGIGITEDCPGFLGQKWMDAQLEATYEGPEAVQRLQLGLTMTNEVFLAQFKRWIREMRGIAGQRPGTGACTLASSMNLWLWTLEHLQKTSDADGKPLLDKQRQGVSFPMADALCWLLASRHQILDVAKLAEASGPKPGEDRAGVLRFLTDLCHVQAARAAGEVSRVCSELVFGYGRHPSWDGDSASCYRSDELVTLEGLMPGMDAGAVDVVGADGEHPDKAGPCARFGGSEAFEQLRRKLDGCLTGVRIAKERAAAQLTDVTIPEQLDYPR